MRSMFLWKFFDSLGHVPVLSYRCRKKDGTMDDWQIFALAHKRSATSLVLNAQGNLYHAYQSLLERLMLELPELTNDSTSYKLASQLIRFHLKQKQVPNGSRFQFKLDIIDQRPGGLKILDVLISTEHEV